MIKKLLFIFFGGLFFISCSKKDSNDTVIARVEGDELTYNDITSRFDTASIRSKQKINDFITHWINTTLIYKEAENSDIIDSDEYKELVEEAKKEIAVNLLLKKEVNDKQVNINEEEIESYYNQHRNEFYLPNDIVSICFAVFSNELAANEFRTKYDNNISWNLLVENFIKSHAQDLVINFQDTTFFKQTDLYPPDIWRSIIQLKVGELSKPLSVFDGYMVVKLNSYQKAGEQGSLEYAKSDIKERLTVEKKRQLYNNFLKNLYKKYKSENLYELSNK